MKHIKLFEEFLNEFAKDSGKSNNTAELDKLITRIYDSGNNGAIKKMNNSIKRNFKAYERGDDLSKYLSGKDLNKLSDRLTIIINKMIA